MNFFQAVSKNLLHNMLGRSYKISRNMPYMRYREMIIFEELIGNLQPGKILEWGSGYSTVYFPKLIKGSYEWLSIENNEAWARHIKELNKDPKVNVEYIPENKPGDYHGLRNDGNYEDFKDYIDFPKKLKPFDFIVIDGRARSACLKLAFELISDKGVVAVHDANRTSYHEHFGLFKYHFLIRDSRKRSGGIALLSKGENLNKLLDTKYHEKKWGYINRLAHFLRV